MQQSVSWPGKKNKIISLWFLSSSTVCQSITERTLLLFHKPPNEYIPVCSIENLGSIPRQNIWCFCFLHMKQPACWFEVALRFSSKNKLSCYNLFSIALSLCEAFGTAFAWDCVLQINWKLETESISSSIILIPMKDLNTFSPVSLKTS